MIPFCKTRIIEIERVQAQVAKFALGMSVNSPNICAQTEFGMKTFQQVLYERQLKFYFRALYIHEDRWMHQALMNHLSGDLEHISKIRVIMNIEHVHPCACTNLAKESLQSRDVYSTKAASQGGG